MIIEFDCYYMILWAGGVVTFRERKIFPRIILLTDGGVTDQRIFSGPDTIVKQGGTKKEVRKHLKNFYFTMHSKKITLMWSISYVYSALLNCLMSRLLILCIIVCNRCGTNWWSLLSGSVHTQILGIWSVFPLERMQTWFVQHILQESYDLLEFLYVKRLRK